MRKYTQHKREQKRNREAKKPGTQKTKSKMSDVNPTTAILLHVSGLNNQSKAETAILNYKI